MADEKPRVRVPAGSAYTADSFANFEAKMGLAADSQFGQGTYLPGYLSQNRALLENMYSTSWLVGAVVDYPAEDMTRAGIEIQSTDNPERIGIMQAAIMDLTIWDKLQEALKWGRLFGGGLAVMMIDGHKMNEPLDINTIGPGQFKGLWVMDRWTAWADTTRTVTALGPDLGLPMYYQTIMGAGQQAETIHYSRVLRFDGQPMPFYVRWRLQLWGASVVQRLHDRLVAYDSATTGGAQLLFKAHLRIMKIADYRNIVAGGGKALDGLIKQLDSIGRFQSSEGLTIVDDKDTFETQNYTFAGIPDMIGEFATQMSGAAEIPIVRLFGQSPGGLGSNGESEVRTYYDGIIKKQENELRRPLTVLLDVLYRSLFGTPTPEGFGFRFNPMWQMTAKEKAEIAKATTEAVAAAMDIGISQQTALKELRASSAITGIFSNISDEDIRDADDEVPEPVHPQDALEAANAPPAGDGKGGSGGPPKAGKTPTVDHDTRDGFDPEEPRDENGMWTSGSGSSGGGNMPGGGRGAGSRPFESPLKGHDFSHLPPASDVRNTIKSWADAKAKGDVGHEQLSSMLGKVATRLGLHRDLATPDDLTAAHETNGKSYLFMGPNKAEQKASDKVKNDYKGDWTRLKDMVRATIAVEHPGQISETITQLKAAGIEFAAQPKDNVAKGTDAGYRDVNTLVRLPNGMIAELQINVKAMVVAKTTAHDFYNEQLKIEQRNPTTAKKDWSPADKAEFETLNRKQWAVYDPAWERATKSPAPS